MLVLKIVNEFSILLRTIRMEFANIFSLDYSFLIKRKFSSIVGSLLTFKTKRLANEI